MYVETKLKFRKIKKMSDSRLLQNFAWFGLFYDALQKESCLRSVNLFSNCNVSNLSVKLVSYAYIFYSKKVTMVIVIVVILITATILMPTMMTIIIE